jgi:hypothetical protein
VILGGRGCLFGGVGGCEQRGLLRRALRTRRDKHAKVKSGVVRQARVKIRASEIVRGMGGGGG